MAISATTNPAPVTSLAPGFEAKLADFDLETLSRQSVAIYGVDTALRLAYLNPAWFDFSERNGGDPAIARDWGLGRSVLDACAEPVRGFYADAYSSAMYCERIWEHDFECSSPESYRVFHQTAYPLKDCGGLLIVNAQVVSRPHEPAAAPDVDPCYRDENGIITQCCHCRKAQHRLEVERWDWVSEWVASSPENTSHGLCPLCLDHYYPGYDV